MSNSSKPRVTRKHIPTGVITRNNYRKVCWDNLLMDFQQRCAYSMQHINFAGGRPAMDVDHFDPRKKRDFVQHYSNLFLSTRNCNGAKSNRWESAKNQARGARFLNCCKEADYGVHIFEDPDTHEVVGVTPEGKYHVRNCDLNAPQLVRERKRRADIWEIFERRAVKISDPSTWSLPPETAALADFVQDMIPKIEYLSGAPLEARRVQRKAIKDYLTHRPGQLLMAGLVN